MGVRGLVFACSLPCDVGREEGISNTEVGSDTLGSTGEKQENIDQKGLNLHCLSLGISSSTFAYLKWRKESRPALHLAADSFPAQKSLFLLPGKSLFLLSVLAEKANDKE